MTEELKELRQRMDARLMSREVARRQYREALDAEADTIERDKECREATLLAQTVAKVIQDQAHRKIADVVSHSLEAVFDEPYEFRILFEQKRGRTEAALVFTRDGMDVDPMTASGGGVVDVAAFALRLSCLLLSRPPLRRLLVLDEPLKFVSTEYRGKCRQLIETLAKDLDVQFVIVTHLPELHCGKVIEL